MKSRGPDTTAVLYGWEADGEYWHGPTELTGNRKRAVEALDASRALCILKTKCRPYGVPMVLTTTVRDVGDCALATIDTDTDEAGLLAVLTVVPANRRSTIRTDFAFEWTAFIRFLEHLCSAGSELALHDHVQQVLDTEKHESIVFALCSPACDGDLSIAVSEYIERVSVAILQWKLTRDSSAARTACGAPQAAGLSRSATSR